MLTEEMQGGHDRQNTLKETTMYCPNCGFGQPDTHRFCISCGLPLPRELPPARGP